MKPSKEHQTRRLLRLYASYCKLIYFLGKVTFVYISTKKYMSRLKPYIRVTKSKQKYNFLRRTKCINIRYLS